MQRFFLLLLAAMSVASCSDSRTVENKRASEATLVDGIYLRDLGPGNRQLELINAIVLDPEAGIDARIVQTTAQEKDALAVVFQPSTGTTSYIRMPDSDGARAISKIGDDVFIGTYLKGQIFRWRPGMDGPQGFQLPRPSGERLEFVFSIDRGSDGKYYIGTWPEGALMRLDLKTGQIENLGPQTDDPPGEYYLRHINSEFEGRVFLSFGTEVSFKEYDLETGETREFLPAEYADRSWVSHSTRMGNMIVALVDSPSQFLFLDANSGELIREVTIPEGRVWPHNYKSLFVYNDEIYFGDSDSDLLMSYNFESDSFKSVGDIGHPIGLAGDNYLFTRTRLGLYTIYNMDTGETELQRQGDFQGDGMLVHAIAEGPDATVVGGTYINQGFFQYLPDADSIFAPGRSVEFSGQIDNLVTYNGKVYIGHYTKARFSVYDPEMPWRMASDSSGNPKYLGTAGSDQDRVPDGVAGPDGRIYFATKPAYGMLGGSLTVLDPVTGSITSHRNVVDQQSVYALASDEDRYIYGTTSVRGGLGARPAKGEAQLFKWDTQQNVKVLQRSVVLGAYEIWGLDWLNENALIGAADSVLFIYNVVEDSVEATKRATPEEIKQLVVSHDGWVYGVTEERFFRTSSRLDSIQVIDVHEGYWDSLVETETGNLYVGRGAHLYEVIRK